MFLCLNLRNEGILKAMGSTGEWCFSVSVNSCFLVDLVEMLVLIEIVWFGVEVCWVVIVDVVVGLLAGGCGCCLLFAGLRLLWCLLSGCVCCGLLFGVLGLAYSCFVRGLVLLCW